MQSGPGQTVGEGARGIELKKEKNSGNDDNSDDEKAVCNCIERRRSLCAFSGVLRRP